MSAQHKPTKGPVWNPVKSSSISAIGHDASGLHVRFANGGTYHYPDVSAAEFAKLKGAESIGKHFQAHIRSKFKGAQVK